MKAWHFLKTTGELRWPCGDVIRPEVGQTLTVEPDRLKLCAFGLHASKKILDALKYAPGEMLCRVELGGRIVKGNNKMVASARTIIAMADATETLHLMAVWSAKRALKRIKNPDPRPIAAIEAKEKWLRGEITDAELAAARAAARAAAWDAASAARDAVRSAARDAAEAAGAAARAAASDAARYAAWAAARYAAWAAANAARAAASDAASDAAWAAANAARSAERKAQNRKLTTMAKRLLDVD